MRRVTVLGHSESMDEVIGALQGADVLEIEAHTEDLPAVALAHDDPRLRVLDEWAADAQFVRDFLARYHTPTQPLSAFVSEKFHLRTEDFAALVPDTRFLRLYKECVAISDRIAHGERERARLRALVSELEPWKPLHLQISRWRGTDHVALFTGTVPASQGPAIRQMLRETAAEATVEEVGPVGSRQAWVVMTHRSVFHTVRAALALTDFAEVSFPGLEDYPAEEMADAQDAIERIEAERLEQEVRARELALEDYAAVVALAESIQAQRDALTVRTRFALTERTFVIRGWVRAGREDLLTSALEPRSDSVDVAFSDPSEDDVPPVELDNPWWLRPFETLTDLYGRPRYDEIDPTPLLAPFFLLFFSICISDVGYGAMLILGAWLIKTRLDVAPGVKKFMDLLQFGGAGAMVIGVLFGSYFALDFEMLPPFLKALRVLDPMNQLTTFLVICVVLGMTQVFLGVIVAGWDAWRRGDRAGAVFGQFSTIFLFAMMGVGVAVPGAARWALPVGLVGTMLMQGGALQAALGERERPVWDRAVGAAWLAAVVGAIVVMALGSVGAGLAVLAAASVGALVTPVGRASVVALLGGAYSVYGMSAFIGDILSYTRLAALGLSGALVGMVFNLLAGLVMEPVGGLFASGGLGVLWGALAFVGAALVFVVGHVFNVVINLLGAFVHPARLQFVEFFSKFYEGGGRPFAPFGLRTKSVVLHAGAAGQEGGTG